MSVVDVAGLAVVTALPAALFAVIAWAVLQAVREPGTRELVRLDIRRIGETHRAVADARSRVPRIGP